MGPQSQMPPFSCGISPKNQIDGILQDTPAVCYRAKLHIYHYRNQLFAKLIPTFSFLPILFRVRSLFACPCPYLPCAETYLVHVINVLPNFKLILVLSLTFLPSGPNGLTYEGRIKSNCMPISPAIPNNFRSSAITQSWISRGHPAADPFVTPPFLYAHCSPVGRFATPNGTAFLILVFSTPRADAVNKSIKRVSSMSVRRADLYLSYASYDKIILT